MVVISFINNETPKDFEREKTFACSVMVND